MAEPAITSGQSWWRRSAHFWLAWEPMRHAWWETFLFRLGIAWLAWQTLCLPSHRVAQPVPHGLAAWGVDFTWLGDVHLAPWLVPVWGVCLLLYVFNFVPVLTLLPPLIASFGHGTLGNSSGSIGHTTQLVTLVLLASWLAALWTRICQWRHRPLPFDFTPPQLAADWARQVFMSTYVVSALSKLIQSHGLWFQNAPYFGLQMIKAMGMAQYGAYGPGNNVEGLAQFMLDHPVLAKIFIGAALPLELFAFLAVLNRRTALFFGISLWLFHNTVTEVLHLGFVYHKALLLILMVNPVWWLVQIIKSLFTNQERRTKNQETPNPEL
jgi:hypothetical protein